MVPLREEVVLEMVVVYGERRVQLQENNALRACMAHFVRNVLLALIRM
jgi:hypothetical protein